MAKLKIPKKFHYSGFDWTVKEMNKLDGRESDGRTMMDTHEIWLEKELTEESKLEVFIHELLHIAYRQVSHELDEKQEERLIKPYALNIYGILKDTKLLWPQT